MVMRKQKRRMIRLAGIALFSFLIIAAVASFNYQHLQRQAARIPVSIRKELTFSPFVINLDAKKYQTTDFKITTAENNVQLLSYVIHTPTTAVTVSESQQLPQFTEIPEYKERFLNNVIKQNATVQTANGTIYIGRLDKQNNKQFAVMLERGLLVLMYPENDMTEAQWRALGEQLEIQKIAE